MHENNEKDFATFLQQLPKRYPDFNVKSDKDEVYMSLLNETACNDSQFLWLRKIEAPFGFQCLVRVEKTAIKFLSIRHTSR